MLQTRLWMGAVLILLAAGMLVFDPAPWFPLLLVLSLMASGMGCFELVSLLSEPRPRRWVAHLAVALLIAANWPANVWDVGSHAKWILSATTAGLILAFVIEGLYYRGGSGATARISLTFWTMGYLGLLASFLIQLRWLPDGQGPLAVAMAIFVPKAGDIGAYFTGRMIGKRPMAPNLSPKKTWEGAAGGLVLSVLAALGLNSLGGWLESGAILSLTAAVGFGLSVGMLAQVGDLMESLIKRDCERKDASAVVPGFGGVLDVLDSILFSAPLSFFWLAS